MKYHSISSSLGVYLVLAGCVQLGPTPISIDNAITLNHGENTPDITLRVQNELATGGVDPTMYTAAGYNYVYRQCTNYFDHLIVYQNGIDFSSDSLAAAGSAATAILNVARSGTIATSAAAAGVSLGTAVLSSYRTRELVTPYPNETKTLILTALDKYRVAQPPEKDTTAAQAVWDVEHFAELCTFSGIGRAAKQALANFQPTAVTTSGTTYATQEAYVKATLGLNEELSDQNLVALYYYLYVSSNATPAQTAQQAAVLKTLPPDVQTLIGNNESSVASTLKSKLSNLYSSSTAFQSSIVAYGVSVTKASDTANASVNKLRGGMKPLLASPDAIAAELRLSAPLASSSVTHISYGTPANQ
jgi:hypothetical protein